MQRPESLQTRRAVVPWTVWAALVLLACPKAGSGGAPDDAGDGDAGGMVDAGEPNDGGATLDAGPPLHLDELWNQQARWRLERSLTLASTGWPYGYGAGAHVEVVSGTWYLFSRRVDWGSTPSYCTSETLETEVRRSTDQGRTWSAPATIITAAPNTPWECAATDGDAYFNATESRWHYLFQCLGRDQVWRGCHVQRDGLDPMGPFAAAHANPVLDRGQLWSKICDQPTDDCARLAGGVGRVYDEGTFDIFAFDGASYFVGFHGFDGVRGYRGIAKTPDFQTWIAGDPDAGVPGDAVFDADDASAWREAWAAPGSVGGGAATILFDDGYYYTIIEASDVNLGCAAGQNWDIGVLRSPTLTATTWQQLPAGNPILYSSRLPERNGLPLPCNPAYVKFFRDGRDLWLHATRESMDPAFSGIYLYRLTRQNNLLQNGDLWRCDTQGWKVFPLGPTHLVVYRYPNGSSDGNCYLATNCGASSCQAGQSIYQDVDVQAWVGRRLSFGGTFMAEGGDGSITVAAHELDAAGALRGTHALPLSLGASYADARSELVVDAGTKTVRLQLYLSTPLTVRADELFLEVSGP